MQSLTCDYLVIAGGGGGGNAGGGAGGYRSATTQTLTAQNYTVTIGAGGSGSTSTNGSDSVFIAIFKQNAFNTIKVCSGLENRMKELLPSLPKSLDYNVCYNQKDYVVESVEDIQLTLYLAFIKLLS